MDYYDSTYDSELFQSPSASDAALNGAAFLGIVIAVLLIVVIVYVVSAIFLGMIFKKAGIESWKAWVPVYNNWVLLEMGGQHGWLSLLAFVPFGSLVTAVFMYIAMYHIAIKFGKDGTLFIVLAIVAPVVWYIWLAVDKTAVWNGSAQPNKTVTG